MDFSGKDNVLIALLGIGVHLVFLSSIFDIYFTSPLVHGMAPVHPQTAAPAKRLFLFSLDGLRADKCYERDEHGLFRTPFLRSVIEKRGCWGVSHTRVPTESRPGHVAMIAGFYEDVSAVTKGWQENPVTFDSVFNESTFTWAWGSPEVIPMFSHAEQHDHVYTTMYDSNEIDFTHSDASQLDVWVFRKIEEFFREASHNHTIKKILESDKIVLFAHLIGIDTNGHSYRPFSKEYLNNIRVVDDGVKRITQLVESFFQDNKTAFVVTSDHGMTQWGTHGAGHDSETLTPLIAWGAGINGPRKASAHYEDDLSESWNLNHLERVDVSQGDIAPLMSALLGLPFPLNSEGILPLGYLNVSSHDAAMKMFANAKQIMAQYVIKERSVKEHSLFFKPFSLSVSAREDYLRQIIASIKAQSYEQATGMSQQLIKESLLGLRYYHTYKRLFLAFVVTMGFVGWILNLIVAIVAKFTHIGCHAKIMPHPSDSAVALKLTAITAVVVIAALSYEGDPIQNYFYSLTPLPFWYQLIKRRRFVAYVMGALSSTPLQTLSLLVRIAASACCLELIVVSFVHRSVLTLVCCLLGLQPLLSKEITTNWKHVVPWSVSVFALGIFPSLPVIRGAEHYLLVYATGALAIVIIVAALALGLVPVGSRRIAYTMTVSVLASLAVKYRVVASVTAKQGVSVLDQSLSWFLLVAWPCLAMATDASSLERLFSMSVATFCVYLLMSISYDLAFYGIFLLCLVSWVHLEIHLRSNEKQPSALSSRQPHLTLHDLRTCLTFVILVFLSFFGTGNIASVNSFDITSLYCFATVLAPFLMGALLLLKICLPLLLLNLFFSSMNQFLRISPAALFSVVLVMTDMMSIHFFFLVQDSGSWLDIGTSISHFVVVLGLIIFLIPIFKLSQYACGRVEWITASRKGRKFQ